MDWDGNRGRGRGREGGDWEKRKEGNCSQDVKSINKS